MSQLYVGVVEDIHDPLKLGRCRVRVVELHTANKVELPTEDLPWATPIQSITSAANSGIGQSPTGLLQGSTVIVVFTDQDQQNPLIIGSIAGIPSSDRPKDINPNDPEFEAKDDESLPSQREAQLGGDNTKDNELYLGPLTLRQYKQLQQQIIQIESSNNPQAVNSLGYIGLYQFGIQALETIGYIKKGSWSQYKSNSAMDINSVWTGKDNIRSKADFLNDVNAQHNAFKLLTQFNYNRLKSNNLASPEANPAKVAGLLGVAHNQGHTAAIKHSRGEVGTDGFGTSTTKYYILCFKSISGTETTEVPNSENIEDDPVDRNSIGKQGAQKFDVNDGFTSSSLRRSLGGFKDPDGKYPTNEYMDEPDVNRLARSQSISKTIVGEKEAGRTRNIHIANSSSTWSQPSIPYNARYPYNHTYTSESGHAMEFDDTPNCERINIHHKRGTFIEIDSNGTQTNKIVGHGCTIIEKDGVVFVSGNAHVHVEGNITIYAGQDISVETKGNANIKSKNVNVIGDESINLKSKSINFESTILGMKSASINMDGFVSTNTGAAIGTPSIESDVKFNGTFVELPVITRSDEQHFSLEGTEEAAVAVQLDKAIGEGKEEILDKDDELLSRVNGDTVSCDFVKPLTLDMRLTPNFKLRNMCVSNGFAFGGQRGMRAEEIICNLKHLAANVMEPIKLNYGDKLPVFTSVFRTPKTDKISQHELGEACDVVFTLNHGPSMSARRFHYEMAKALKETVPFDQMLLEYVTGGPVWIHLSYTSKRPLRYQILTLNNHRTVGQGLILMGVNE